MPRGALRPIGSPTRPMLSRHVLLAGEPSNARRAIAIALRVRGHLADEVDDAQTALAWSKRVQYDLAVIDAGLSDMSGAELSCALEACSTSMHVVLAGEPALPSLSRLPAELRRTRVLNKPLEAADLLALLDGASALNRD